MVLISSFIHKQNSRTFLYLKYKNCVKKNIVIDISTTNLIGKAVKCSANSTFHKQIFYRRNTVCEL